MQFIVTFGKIIFKENVSKFKGLLGTTWIGKVLLVGKNGHTDGVKRLYHAHTLAADIPFYSPKMKSGERILLQ